MSRKKEQNVPNEDRDPKSDELDATPDAEATDVDETDADVTVTAGGATASAFGIPTFSKDGGKADDDANDDAADGDESDDAADLAADDVEIADPDGLGEATDEADDLDDSAADDENDLGGAVDDEPFAADDDVPEELAGLRPTGDEPKTGLVSEFHDLKPNQAAWLVNNRDSSALSRSPMFIVAVVVIALGVLAALLIGWNQAKASGAGEDTSNMTLATVGLGSQADAAQQQLGVKIKDVDTLKEAQSLVSSGQAEAAYVQDSSSGSVTVIAKDKEPTALLNKLTGKPTVTLLEQPRVSTDVANPVLWGLAALTIITFLTLGQAVFGALRVEKRNRIAEVVAATLPPRAAARGRVNSTFTGALIYLLVAYVILLLGLSVLGYSSLVVAMLPGLGWFIGLHLAATLIYPSLYLWAGSLAGAAARRVLYIVSAVIVVAGNFVPMFFDADSIVTRVLSYIPFTAPVALTKLYFANHAEWWMGLVSVAIAVVVGLILLVLASGAYERNLLAGSGRAGKAAKAKKAKKDKKVAAGAKAASAKADSAKAGASEDEDAKDTDAEVAEAADSDAEAADSDADESDAVDSAEVDAEEDSDAGAEKSKKS